VAVFHFLKSTSLTYTSNDVTPVIGNVFEAMPMMEKGQDQIPDEGFLMTKDKNAYVFYSYCSSTLVDPNPKP